MRMYVLYKYTEYIAFDKFAFFRQFFFVQFEFVDVKENILMKLYIFYYSPP